MRNFSRTAGEAILDASASSAPIISGTSESIADPPALTTASTAEPITGFEVIPENESEAPHSVPTMRALKGTCSLLAVFTSPSLASIVSLPLLSALPVPPSACMLR